MNQFKTICSNKIKNIHTIFRVLLFRISDQTRLLHYTLLCKLFPQKKKKSAVIQEVVVYVVSSKKKSTTSFLYLIFLKKYKDLLVGCWLDDYFFRQLIIVWLFLELLQIEWLLQHLTVDLFTTNTLSISFDRLT